jgi:L-lactate utilization protein LutB
MSDFQDSFWQLRLENCKESLEKNNFEVFLAADGGEAKTLFFENILPGLDVRTASWADSMTLHETGILDEIKKTPGISMIETFAKGVPREELLERRRQALLVDLFFTGTNALTEKGQLVNLDMIGNRVGAIAYGPRTVLLLIGRNKIVKSLDDAMARVRSHAAPLNAIRHEGWKTPCRKTSYCIDCSSPDRICNTWVITEKSFPKKRIKIILINQDCGL